MWEIFFCFQEDRGGSECPCTVVPQVASIQNNEYAMVVHYGACPWPLQGNIAKTWADAQ